MAGTAFYRTVWRWHFYAGLFVLPFILVLSLTGSIYLFKPQIDRWEETAFHDLGTRHVVSADRQLEAALGAFPGSRFIHYRLPQESGDAAMLQLAAPDGRLIEAYVSPQGHVLGTLDPEVRLSSFVKRIHSSLLMGQLGNWLVELAACWAIVMIVSGLYLWWPRGAGLAGTLWPRLSLRGRAFWKDLHRVTGIWSSALVLVLLFSGLPWASVWGSAFKTVRTELGLIEGPQDWQIDDAGGHAHHIMAMPPPSPAVEPAVPLSRIVAMAEAERLAFPALILPPGAPQMFGPPTGEVWTATSMAQNRTLGRTITYDLRTGAELSRTGFADRHAIDRVINYGIAWHEGQLFGLANQLIGVATALALMALSVSGTVMWLRRRPARRLGAPPPAPHSLHPRGAMAVILLLAALLPLFTLSLAAVWLLEWLVLRRLPRIAGWFGLPARSGSHRSPANR